MQWEAASLLAILLFLLWRRKQTLQLRPAPAMALPRPVAALAGAGDAAGGRGCTRDSGNIRHMPIIGQKKRFEESETRGSASTYGKAKL